MDTSGNTVLITGGASGIGFALAEAFTMAGNSVLICGRRAEKLREAKEKLPGIHTFHCDVSVKEDRMALLEWTTKNFPPINILVNNAGIQRMIDLRKGEQGLDGEDEIAINLSAPIQLTAMFLPTLMKQKSAIVNVTSGLGFVPLTIVPIYCATKAAMHSYTMSLRHQLRETPISVFELIPPTVDTELDHGARERRGQTDRGIAPAEVAEAALAGLAKDEFEIAVGMAQELRSGNRDEIFKRMNH